ncbi:MAG: metallophosphoesterase family protein [Clostridiales bacterium]|nr:metallophosphoesterase family protein [Clostridiales bacterium]
MSVKSRFDRAFQHALELPVTNASKYVLISDCHRGNGTTLDNFLKNQHLYFAALKHYYQEGYTYIELGDGDELWENRNMEDIIEVHSNIFWLLSLFYQQNRLYMIYGNHDIVKSKPHFAQKKCASYFCSDTQNMQTLFPDLSFHEGIILYSVQNPNIRLYLTHGHQASLLNSTLWPAARFLVRYFWHPLELFGISDPTSAAKNYHVKTKCQRKSDRWARQQNRILITGHTHRPVLSEENRHYFNTGSCVHPRCITCIELENGSLTLVKWCIGTKPDKTLYVVRERLSGPVKIIT